MKKRKLVVHYINVDLIPVDKRDQYIQKWRDNLRSEKLKRWTQLFIPVSGTPTHVETVDLWN